MINASEPMNFAPAKCPQCTHGKYVTIWLPLVKCADCGWQYRLTQVFEPDGRYRVIHDPFTKGR